MLKICIYLNVFIIKFWVVYVPGDCIFHVLKLSMLIETFTCMQRGLRLLRFCCFFSLKCFYNGARCRRYYDCHGNNNGNPITPLSWLQPSCWPFSSLTGTETHHQHNRERQRQILFHHHPELFFLWMKKQGSPPRMLYFPKTINVSVSVNETASFSRIAKVCKISVLGSSVIRYRGASQ